MKISPKYIKQLMNNYGLSPSQFKIFQKKLFWNFIWHLTPTEIQVQRMEDILDQYSIKGLFFVTANLIERDPSRLKIFKNHEVAPHGYMHINYSKLTYQEAIVDMGRAINAFRENGVEVDVYRAPYAAPRLKDGSSWYDALHSFNVPYSSSFLLNPPVIPYKESGGIIEFPILSPTDDMVIEIWNKRSPSSVAKELFRKILHTKNSKQKSGNILIYCLHPLRMGQKNYLPVVKSLLERINSYPGFELASFSTAVKEWKKQNLKGRNLVVISGDIDCWTFFDYIRRLKYF
jgi:Polysaccharide deacetylase